jgi:hypothetical protein
VTGPLEHTGTSTDEPQLTQYDAGSRQMGSHDAAVQFALDWMALTNVYPPVLQVNIFLRSFSADPASREYELKFTAKWH